MSARRVVDTAGPLRELVEFRSGACGGAPRHRSCAGNYRTPDGATVLHCTCKHCKHPLPARVRGSNGRH